MRTFPTKFRLTYKTLFFFLLPVLSLALLSFYFLTPHLSRASEPVNRGNVLITLERTQCFGSCPAYKLTIYESGFVVYEGEKYVRVTGTRAAQIPQEQVKSLIDAFVRVNYFSLEGSYSALMSDLSTAITSFTFNGKTKKIFNNGSAPKELHELERTIDQTVNSDRWVKMIWPPFF